MRPLTMSLASARKPSALPLRVFFAVLVLVFGFEYAIMIFLDSISPPRPGEGALNFVDSTLLTVMLAPALWLLVVRPLQRLFEARGRLLGQLFAAQEEERARIARDLHDELGQQLTAVMVGLRTVQDGTTVEECRERAAAAARAGAGALDSVRAIARGLRPAVLEDLGLVPAVERLCEELRSVHDLEVSLKLEVPSDRRFPTAVEVCVYRLLQESLTNAARHSGATRVMVELRASARAVELEVSDDGRGFDLAATPPGSTGLDGMKERVAMLDGQLRITAGNGQGTRVLVSLPLDEAGVTSRGALAGRGHGKDGAL